LLLNLRPQPSDYFTHDSEWAFAQWILIKKFNLTRDDAITQAVLGLLEKK
jgi:hypothetical protein